MTAPRRRLLVATGSAHKLIELQRLFGDLPIDLVTLIDLGITDEAPEDGVTFEENALQKARWYSAASSEWTLADDSGLEVAALNGAPGVYTRRYAGPDATDQQNYEKLLTATVGVADRSARFVCTMALIDPVNGSARTFRGECTGHLTTAPRGEFGFGYDPIFEVDGRTMAERAPAEKDALSHRGRAAVLVAAALRSELEQTR
ncbi:MAG: RdgB/HAM1 family non-canonical purine NTP pyrophosphatase [Candidatus Aquidulcis sp.]|nr:MAG: RdgB/HAM1 family non-canonical purine NTP pyrophosphatase [Candidatus Aquidulcis sp.]